MNDSFYINDKSLNMDTEPINNITWPYYKQGEI